MHSCFLGLGTWEGISETTAVLGKNVLILPFHKGLTLNQMYALSIFRALRGRKGKKGISGHICPAWTFTMWHMET